MPAPADDLDLFPTLACVTEDEVRGFLTRWWDGVWRSGNIDLVDELFADPYVHHSARGTATITPADLKERMLQYQRVLHGSATSVDDLAVVGDTAWLRATSTGVNLETDSPSIVTWMIAYRFAEGRVVEAWVATVPGVDWRG